jgi:serine/threonine protein kinase
MEYVHASPFTKYYPTMQDSDIRAFMYNLLYAVGFAHSKGKIICKMQFLTDFS